jgi:DNA invertase Pin-like site-specific DNA recombinase
LADLYFQRSRQILGLSFGNDNELDQNLASRSTDQQDATRARSAIEAFAADHGLTIAGWFIENESGAKLARPELFRLLADGRPGDVLLVEQVDRLSRLNDADWRKLRAELDAKQIRVVALDLPTSWQLADTKDEFTSRMFGAINGMMLEIDPERTFPGSGAGCLLGREARKPFPQFIFRLLRWRGRRCDRGPRVPPIRTVLRANSQ